MERRTKDIPVNVDRRKEIETAFQTLLDTTAAMILLNRGEKLLYANAPFYERSGYIQEDLSTLKFSDLFTENYKDIYADRTARRLQGEDGLPERYANVEIISKNGKIFYCDVYPNVIYYKGELATIYTAIDKTIQRKSERALEEFFEYCPVSMFIRDKETRNIKMTKHFEVLLNRPLLDLIGKTNHEVWPSDYADKINEEDKYVFDHKKPIVVEGEFQGQHYITTKFPINGDLLGGFSMDISDRVAIENKLIDSNKKYQELYSVLASLLDAMPDMIWIYDTNKNIKFANKALRESEIGDNIFGMYECMMPSDKPEVFIKEHFHMNEKVYLEITKTPLFDPENNVVGCSGVVRDVTITVKRQNKIMKKLEKLEGVTLKETKSAISDINQTISNFNERWSHGG